MGIVRPWGHSDYSARTSGDLEDQSQVRPPRPVSDVTTQFDSVQGCSNGDISGDVAARDGLRPTHLKRARGVYRRRIMIGGNRVETARCDAYRPRTVGSPSSSYRGYFCCPLASQAWRGGSFSCLVFCYSSRLIGWEPSPFQFEVGWADLAIGASACITFWQDLGFKTAAASAASIFLLGDAVGHVRETLVAGISRLATRVSRFIIFPCFLSLSWSLAVGKEWCEILEFWLPVK